MDWKEDYKKIDIKYKLKYLLPDSYHEYVTIYISYLFILLIYLMSFTIEYMFFFILMFFSTFIYKSLISLFYIIEISFYYKIHKNNLLGFKQYGCLNEYNKLINQPYKVIKKIFFVSILYNVKINKKIIYAYGNYKFIEYLKEYQTDKYIKRYIVTVFLMTSIAFYGLILELNSIDINDDNKNFLFLFSILYVLYIIYYSYSPYLHDRQKMYFIDYTNGFPREYFLIDDNLDREKEDIKKLSDILAIVFGVLFSLYIGLAYDTIYTVGVDIKKISVDNNSQIIKGK